MKRVAIIGAGPGGLCAAKHLLSATEWKIEPVVFEQRTCVGGTWVYEETNEENNVFSSIYKNLKTNLPKQVMNFPDFPFPKDWPSFLHHTQVLKYLNDYATHFRLLHHVKFETRVVSVDPLINDNNENSEKSRWCRWSVEYQHNGCQEQRDEFDAVIVCNGHYSVPKIPHIPGLEDFYKGTTIHSHYYRDPEEFKGTKNAIVLGFGPSGSDILLDLAPVCENVYMCHKGDKFSLKLPSNCQQRENISHVNQNGQFMLTNGDVISDVELLVICTGYLYDFPFLSSEKVNLKNENGRVLINLYKHLIHIDYPSLSFVGIPMAVSPFPLMHQQCGYITKLLTGNAELPSAEKMRQDVENEIQACLMYAIPRKYFHKFIGARQFEYNNMLADLSGLSRNPKVIESLYVYNSRARRADLLGYKKLEYEQIDDVEFRLLEKKKRCDVKE